MTHKWRGIIFYIRTIYSLSFRNINNSGPPKCLQWEKKYEFWYLKNFWFSVLVTLQLITRIPKFQWSVPTREQRRCLSHSPLCPQCLTPYLMQLTGMWICRINAWIKIHNALARVTINTIRMHTLHIYMWAYGSKKF